MFQSEIKNEINEYWVSRPTSYVMVHILWLSMLFFKEYSLWLNIDFTKFLHTSFPKLPVGVIPQGYKQYGPNHYIKYLPGIGAHFKYYKDMFNLNTF